MGMSASQSRYMFLTARNSDITLELNLCANSKLSLNRESRANAEEYQRGMNAKKYVWSSNNGATRTDLTYALLTTPTSANNKQPYMVTDLNDRIVLDKNLTKFAETLSPDGKPFAWEDPKRLDILSALTGIDAADIQKHEAREAELKKLLDAVNAAKSEMLKYPLTEKNTTYLQFVKSSMSSVTTATVGTSGNPSRNFPDGSLANAYSNGRTVDLTLTTAEKNSGGGSYNLVDQVFKRVKDALTQSVYNTNPYFGDNEDTFLEALDSVKQTYLSKVKNAETIAQDGTSDAIYGSKDAYKVDVRKLVNEILSQYEWKINEDGSDDKITWYQASDDYKKALKAYNDAVDAYNKALSDNQGLLTAEEENMIKYYDLMFSTIAEKGWVYNPRVNDPEYLNEMFQNNLFTLTTVEKATQFDIKENDYVEKKIYTTDFAPNCSKLICVTDTDAQDEARIKYEHKKNLINDKETRIDLRMTDLQTELSANKQMMEGINTVKGENIERTFKIFA